MKFLLTNDDGIDAEGLSALEQALSGLGQLMVMAPSSAYSGCGHQLTTHRPLRAKEHAERRFSVDGSPADCTRLGLTQFMQDADWVVSGINHGGNLGSDVFPSGTVAAAREAALLGYRAVAFSHYMRRGLQLDWELAQRWTLTILQLLLELPLEAGHFWNVNFPHLDAGSPTPPHQFCPLDRHPLPVEFRLDEAEPHVFHYSANYHNRKRADHSDVAVCFAGQISVTKLEC